MARSPFISTTSCAWPGYRRPGLLLINGRLIVRAEKILRALVPTARAVIRRRFMGGYNTYNIIWGWAVKGGLRGKLLVGHKNAISILRREGKEINGSEANKCRRTCSPRDARAVCCAVDKLGKYGRDVVIGMLMGATTGRAVEQWICPGRHTGVCVIYC